MHVPKCAGTSVHEALDASLPAGSVASRRSDTSIFCDFSTFDQLEEPARSLVAVNDAEIAALAHHSVVSGHFSLPTLLTIAPASNVATVLREPRARLLSAFMFLRLTPVVEFWGPYGRDVLERPARGLETCLSDARVAGSVDNQLCRLVLYDDSRIRDGRFVAPRDADALASAALERLDRLGYVGILEQDDIWDDMSRFFGVSLAPTRANVSGSGQIPAGALPIPAPEMRVVLELIDQRSKADRLVYDVLLGRRLGDSAQARLAADAAFASELMRFGDMTGTAATKLNGIDVDATAHG